jgi:hypothetical protein
MPVGARFSAPIQTGPWGPPSLLYNGYWVFPRGKEQPGRDADPSPPSSAVDYERVELYLCSPYGPYGLYTASVPVQGCTVPFSLPYKIQSGPKKFIHSLLINIFGINLNDLVLNVLRSMEDNIITGDLYNKNQQNTHLLLVFAFVGFYYIGMSQCRVRET